MSRICAHVVVENNCSICGTTVEQIGVGFTCIWRDVLDESNQILRPEPKEREYAVYDCETISKRILELEEEKLLMINHNRVEEDD